MAIPHPFAETANNNRTSTHQSREKKVKEFEKGWFVNEADELVNMDYMKLAEKMSDVCTSTGGCDIPSAHRMTVKVGYDLSLAEKVSSSRNIADPTSEEAREAVEEWMEEAMTHCQALMWHCSLPTQITLDVSREITLYLLTEGSDRIFRAT